MSSLGRKKAESMDSLIKAWIKTNRIATPLNRHLVFSAWDQASGAGHYTIRRYFKDGKFAVDGSNYAFKDIRSQRMEVVGNFYDNP